MTKLVLSNSNSQLLRRLAEQQSNSAHPAIQSLHQALDEQPERPKMTEQSPAVPLSSANEAVETRLVLDHKLLISIASWAMLEDRIDALRKTGMEANDFKLSSLVAGSHVYIAPKPVFHRPKELEDSLAAIKRAQEEAEYQRISSVSAKPISAVGGAYKIPSSYVNIAGVDPSLDLAQRISSHIRSQSQSQSKFQSLNPSDSVFRQENEDQAWKEAQRMLSVILNIFLSTLATATAAWWASGSASVGHKVLISMLVALVTAVAEVVLYNRYSVYVKESKKIKSNRMKGSDTNKHAGRNWEFKPLQLDSGGSAKTRGGEKRSETLSEKDPPSSRSHT